MAERKIIAVVGATGSQGGGLARAILDDPDSPFRVRALTRKPDSDAARALRERGAEVVRADLDDPDSLERAFDGAYGAFCVTNFWEHFSPEKEKAQAERMADAARAAGLEHVVWSTFEDTRELLPLDDDRMPVLQERYNVPHFDAKAEADSVFRDRGVPTTFLRTSFYWENLIWFGAHPTRGPDGVLGLTMCMGDRPLPGISSEDIGKVAYGIFRRGEPLIGQTLAIAGELLTGHEMARALTDALGEEVRYNDLPPDQYRALPFDGADEMGNMFQYKRDFSDDYAGQRDPARARELDPELLTFRAWLARRAKEIPIEPRKETPAGGAP